MRRLRVLVVVPGMMIGGAERYIARTSPALAGAGIDVEVCALDPAGPVAGELTREGIAVHGTSFARWTSKTRAWVLPRALLEIRRLARTGRFDIVHSYLYWADVLASLAGRAAGVDRVIVSRRALHWWRHPQRFPFHSVESISNLAATELIANSRRVLDDTVASERFVPRRRGVVYNGIDISAYSPVPRVRSGPLRLVTVGALAPRKGQSVAIAAVSHAAGAGLDVRLTLVGAGPDEHALRDQAARAGVAERVEFAGEHPDPRPYLGAADVFLLPSRQEGFSNALIEAMASGLPAIVTDVGGNAEAVVDGSGGRVVPAEDPVAMASAIAELSAPGAGHDAMGRFNRERCERLFTLEASTRNLADWYRTSGS